jgi:hypothetical protein
MAPACPWHTTVHRRRPLEAQEQYPPARYALHNVVVFPARYTARHNQCSTSRARLYLCRQSKTYLLTRLTSARWLINHSTACKLHTLTAWCSGDSPRWPRATTFTFKPSVTICSSNTRHFSNASRCAGTEASYLRRTRSCSGVLPFCAGRLTSIDDTAACCQLGRQRMTHHQQLFDRIPSSSTATTSRIPRAAA